jgi:hypothetical protein
VSQWFTKTRIWILLDCDQASSSVRKLELQVESEVISKVIVIMNQKTENRRGFSFKIRSAYFLKPLSLQIVQLFCNRGFLQGSKLENPNS